MCIKKISNLFQNSVIDISDLKTGVYFLRLFYNDEIITKKIIKE
jgi:hypothetical protein